mgnify:CR=1 FL=1
MMFQSDLNWWAVLVAALAAYILGALWYSPLLFGKTWLHLMGWSREQMEHHKKEALRGYLINFVATFVVAAVLAHVVYFLNVVDWQEGLETGFWMWLGFVVTVQLGGVLWEGKKFALFLLNTGYNLASLLAMGVILAVWQ